jgi:hypothetical protein
MCKKMTSLVIGAALVIGAGAVSAEEPMRLTAAQMDGVTAGADIFERDAFRFDFAKRIDKAIVVDKFVDKNAYSDVQVRGNLAEAEAFAKTTAPDGLAETETFTFTDGFTTIANSDSLSAAN